MAADKKTAPIPPVGTVAPPTENPELVGLRESEKAFIEKGERLEKMDANEQAKGGVDLQQVKQKNAAALANVRKEIAKLSK